MFDIDEACIEQAEIFSIRKILWLNTNKLTNRIILLLLLLLLLSIIFTLK
jgi:hypothetical protein